MITNLVSTTKNNLYLLRNAPEDIEEMTDFELIEMSLAIVDTSHIITAELAKRGREYKKEGCF